MRIIAAGLALLLAACGPPASESSAPPDVTPGPSATLAATPTITPSPTRPPLGLATEAIVATITPTESGPIALRVEAASFDGIRRVLADLDVLEIPGAGSYSLGYPFRLESSHESWLAMTLEAPPGSNRLLLVVIDLADLSAAPVVVAVSDGTLAWGPGGSLAVDSRNRVTTIVPTTHDQQGVDVPRDVGTLGAWTADGSGWAATSYDASTETTTVGVVTSVGEFRPGLVSLYQPTGTERFWSATGATLYEAVGDGPGGAVTVVYEEGSDPEHAWFTLREPSDDPRLGDMIWDAAATGMWYLLDYGTEIRLAHRSAPDADYEIRAAFPRTGAASFEGIAKADSSFIVSMRTEVEGDIGELLWVDGTSGVVRSLGRAPNILAPPPIFAGWAGDLP